MWTMDRDGVMLTADQARRWLREVIADRDLVGAHWDSLLHIDKGLGIRPPLLWAAYLKHRDGIMEDRELWESLSDGLRAWMAVLGEDEVSQLVAMVIEKAIAHYGESVPDDDDDEGDWFLMARDQGRALTKAEAESVIIDLVITGDRQDILDRLADWNDDFKVMLGACPLESETATKELVRAVVKAVVAQEYCERAEE